VHVVYGGAHLFEAGTADKLGRLAREAMAAHGADDERFAAAVGEGAAHAGALARRVREKLEREPVEAMCIDFEDGYGPRPDAEEDAAAARAAGELAKRAGEHRPVVGIRVKAPSGSTEARALRTLDLFVRTLVREAEGRVPEGFTVTLPKVSVAEEVSRVVDRIESLEDELDLPARTIDVELMVETPRALYDESGRVALPALVHAARGRCVAAHLGAYDLTAALGVAASEQSLDHPACDTARSIMTIALADTGVAVVDGATTTLPTPRHKASPDRPLSAGEVEENIAAVERAWSVHAGNVRRALRAGIYEGWDLHPAQLPARYGAVYAFFLRAREAMAARLARFVAAASQATRAGQVFDDAATGQGLLVFFLRGLACGALDEADLAATGLGVEEMRARSFAEIVAARTGGSP